MFQEQNISLRKSVQMVQTWMDGWMDGLTDRQMDRQTD